MTFFSVDHESSVLDLPPGSTVLVLGVGGIAMSQLAVAMKEMGYSVIGFDQTIYEPSISILRRENIRVIKELTEIPETFDFCIIGNSVTRNHPVLPLIEKQNLRFCSMPKLVSDFVKNSKTRIVIAGTHGKSTTTALTAFMLEKLGCAPSYLVGAVSRSGAPLVKFRDSSVAVLEGDEYDSAFYAKFSKFRYYNPSIFLIGPLDYDHRDIFRSESEYYRNFTDYIACLSDSVQIVLKVDSLQKLIKFDRENILSRIYDSIIQFQTAQACVEKITANIARIRIKDKTWEIKHNLVGSHNLENLLAASLATYLTSGALPEDISDFWGLKRRLEVVAETEELILIDDFAHHPTEVQSGIAALRETFPNHKICILFEPRSNTSRSRIFQDEYALALSGADLVFIRRPIIRHNDNPGDMLNPETVLKKSGADGAVIEDITAEAVRSIFAKLKNLEGRKIVAVMSNGSFDGLLKLLKDQLTL